MGLMVGKMLAVYVGLLQGLFVKGLFRVILQRNLYPVYLVIFLKWLNRKKEINSLY